MQQIEANDEIEGHTLLTKELARAANDIVNFSKSFTATVWKRHFRGDAATPSTQEVEAICPDKVFLPFVVEPPGKT